MHSKKNKNFSFIFVFGFLLLFLITIGLFLTGFYFSISERDSMEERISEHLEKAKLIKQMHHASRERHIIIWKASITSDPFELEEILETFNQHGSLFISAENKLKETKLDIEEQAYVKLLDKILRGPGTRGRALLDQVLEGKDITDHLLSLNNPFKRQDQYLKVLEKLADYQTDAIERTRSQTQENITKNIIFISLSLLLIFLAGGLLSFFSIRHSSQLVNNLRNTKNRLDAINANLEARVEERTHQLEKTNATLESFANDLEKQVEKRASQFEEISHYNRTLFQKSPVGLALCGLDGRLVDVNQSYLDLIGYSEEEAKQLSYWDITPKDYEEDEKKQLKKLDETGQYGPYEKKYKHKDGSKVNVRLHGIYVELDNQKYIWSSVENIDEQIKTRQNLIESKEKAEQANLEKSQFLANMSHEFRTPMHAISSFSKLGFTRSSDEKTKKYFDRINVSAVRLNKLIDDLLDLSKLEAGKVIPDYREHNLVAVINETVKSIASLAEEKLIDFEINPNKDILIEFDKELITQLLLNLFSNAIKFSPENGKIIVTIQTYEDMTEISVMDQGIGVPKNELESIFDSFSQSSNTDTGSGGTGLGLSISKEIVNLHNGKIWVESPPKSNDYGTQFFVNLPTRQSILDKSKNNLDDENSKDKRELVWKTEYSVGVEYLDNQHKTIISLINKLIKASENSSAGFNYKDILDDLYIYINKHLVDEELFLKKNGYPFFSSHKDLHSNFKLRIQEFNAASEEEPEDFLLKLILFLRHWWDHHILEEDMKYKEFFEKE